MNITWIGQAGLLIKCDGYTIIVDPYLSDNVAKFVPKNKRRQPIDESLFEIKPDVVLITHSHLDHTDEPTLRHYINEDSCVTVLSPTNAWQQIKKYGGNNNYVLVNPGTQWSFGNIRISTVAAEHSDPCSVGFIIDAEGKKYYISGDTLYNTNVIEDVKKTAGGEEIYCAFLPINGVGNNMNITDAARFANDIGTRFAVPVHFGMFDSLDPSDFEFENKIIPHMYGEIVFPD
ncbi:MAG: MBL fold metallo-hydrolase [Eubacteriales bacterium]|nr:MBL fold metallo-hydrolase [Eubacteriales bacterium]